LFLLSKRKKSPGAARALSPLSPRCRASPPWRDTPVAMYGVYLVVPRFAKALVHRDFTLCLCLFAGARVKAGAPSLMRKKITGKNVCEKTSISDPFTHQRLCVPPQRGAWHVAGRDGRHDARGVERPRERHGGGAIVTPPQFVADVDSDDEDISVCPVFVRHDDCDLVCRRNLDASFARAPTLPRKRRMPSLLDGNTQSKAYM